MIVTIDPGNDTGWALWQDSRLLACGLGDPRACPLHLIHLIQAVWIESPVVYPRSKVPPNDVCKLARTAGLWGGRYDACAVEVNFVEPRTWKGSVPKPIHHARIRANLSREAAALVRAGCKGVAPSKRHNVLDAVGLGLWVGRRA